MPSNFFLHCTVYRSISCTVAHQLSLLYSCPSLQFSVSTVIHSVQSEVCTVSYLYRWTPARFYTCRYSIPVVIHLFSHPFVLSSICSDVCLYSCSYVQSSIWTVFFLFCHLFFSVCNLYSFLPVLSSVLYSLQSLQMDDCTVICLYIQWCKSFVQLYVCTVISMYRWSV